MKIKSGTGTDMKRFACGMAVGVFLLVEAPTSGWCQQYLYTPSTVSAEGAVPGKDGILVQEVLVQKGDTLSGISRRFSGHGSYFPQILLFNDIKNPNRIYPGNVFKVPVSRNAGSAQGATSPVKKEQAAEAGGETAAPRKADATPVQKQVPTAPYAATVVDGTTHDLKKDDVVRDRKRGAREKAAGTKKQATQEKHHAAAVTTADTASGQKLFERAVKAYRQDDCRSALELFDKFLAENQASPLAADASLYKAECYLKLSAQN